jgi:hypothetical protein
LVGIAAEPRQREFKPRDLQATHRVRQQLLEAPQNSGVYIMKGNDDEILYIGKVFSSNLLKCAAVNVIARA